jgi:hypothetical protein
MAAQLLAGSPSMTRRVFIRGDDSYVPKESESMASALWPLAGEN